MTISTLKKEDRRLTVILCAGFEDRAVIVAKELAEQNITAANVVLVSFGGPENEENRELIADYSKQICASDNFFECSDAQLSKLSELLSRLRRSEDLVIFDVTGCSRTIMMKVLSKIYDCGLEFDILYTEAEEYYPTFSDYEQIEIAGDVDDHSAFLKLNAFEESEVLYSSHCELEGFEDLQGRMLPNYPLYLITFLPFKRGRLSAILQALETNIRVLVRGQPVRDDLKWRGDAVDIPNADLLHDSLVFDVETLDWKKTYEFLVKQFESNQNRYKFNFIVAPLGSKMQTVGCWLFAKEHPDVRLITSTPKHHYPGKYSSGSRDTFLFKGFSDSMALGHKS